MSWCENNGVFFLFGLQRNKVLQRILRGTMRTAKSMQAFNNSQCERVYKDFRYKAKRWNRKRRVVGKAEYTQGGENPRFVKLFKIGAIIKVSVRRVFVALSESHPMQELWFKVGRKLFSEPLC